MVNHDASISFTEEESASSETEGQERKFNISKQTKQGMKRAEGEVIPSLKATACANMRDVKKQNVLWGTARGLEQLRPGPFRE